jgi:hypothetical protein
LAVGPKQILEARGGSVGIRAELGPGNHVEIDRQTGVNGDHEHRDDDCKPSERKPVRQQL